MSPLGCAVLAPIVADWALSIASNSLWLDCRLNVKKSLFTSLPLLVKKASNSRKNEIVLSDEKLNKSLSRKTVSSDNVEDQITMYLSETIISCIMALSISTPGLDPYATGCLLKTLRLCQISPMDKNEKNMKKEKKENVENTDDEGNKILDEETREKRKNSLMIGKITNTLNNDDKIESDTINEKDILILNNEKRIEECSLDLSSSLSRMFPSADDSPETIPRKTDKLDEKEDIDNILLTQLKEALTMISLKYYRKEHSFTNYNISKEHSITDIAPLVQNNNLSFTTYFHNSNRDRDIATNSSDSEIENENENENENMDEKEKKSLENKKKNLFDDSLQETSIFKFFNDAGIKNENENENENDALDNSETKDDNNENENDNDDDSNNNDNNYDNENDEDDNDNFSDWDEDEVEIEVKTSRITRRSSFCLLDDLTVMEDEMEKLLLLLI